MTKLTEKRFVKLPIGSVIRAPEGWYAVNAPYERGLKQVFDMAAARARHEYYESMAPGKFKTAFNEERELAGFFNVAPLKDKELVIIDTHVPHAFNGGTVHSVRMGLLENGSWKHGDPTVETVPEGFANGGLSAMPDTVDGPDGRPEILGFTRQP